MTRGTATLIWALTAVVLCAAVITERKTRSPLDDLRSERQRPGVLSAARGARLAVPVSDEVPSLGRRALVIFLRLPQYSAVATALSPDVLPGDSDIALVLPSRPPGSFVPAPVGFDVDGGLARAYGMDRPADGGPPVGYALVDRAGRVRYATLDPEVAGHFREIRTLLSGLP